MSQSHLVQSRPDNLQSQPGPSAPIQNDPVQGRTNSRNFVMTHASPSARPMTEGDLGTPVEFLEMGFTPLGIEAALDAIVGRPADAAFTYVVTPNVDHVVRLQRHRSDLWPVYRQAWMTLCDSNILAQLARPAARDLPVVPGSDLTAMLLARGVGSDRIAILGGRTNTVETVAERYGLRDVRHYNPPMGFIRDPREVARAVRFVVEAKARYTFLAVGSPQQEIVAHRVAKSRGGQGIGLCVGASLEYLSGEQSRAPVLMQHMSLEWLYRLGTSPQRLWRRYLIDGPQIFLINRLWRRSLTLAESHAGEPGRIFG